MAKKKCTNGIDKFCFWTAKNVVPLTVACFVFLTGLISASVYNAYEAGRMSGKMEIMIGQITSLRVSVSNLIRMVLMEKGNERPREESLALVTRAIDVETN